MATEEQLKKIRTDYEALLLKYFKDADAYSSTASMEICTACMLPV